MPITTFNPKLSGWHFKNSDIKWSAGPFTGKALCGGMVYSALDYYLHQMAIPSYYSAPVEGNPVHSYIYDRQLSAHASTLGQFAYWWQNSIVPHTQHFNQLLNAIKSGIPQAICLFRGFGEGHHVLATDVTTSPVWSITTYDPNYPDQFTHFTLNGNKWTSAMYGTPWRGYFLDPGYQKKAPNLIGGQNGWRWCRKCQGLFFYQTGTKCPAGGPHDAVGSPDYYLPKESGSGQNNWRYCKLCAGLYFAGHSTSRCPAGGMHTMVGSGDYYLGQNTGKGEPNWRFCKNCAGLFWAGEGRGRCPAAYAGHDASASGNYWLTSVPIK